MKAVPRLALLALLALPAPAAALDGYADYAPNLGPFYDTACYRAWEPQDRPGLLARWLAPQGDYMGSLRIQAAPAAEGADARCNQRFSECQGRCFGE